MITGFFGGKFMPLHKGHLYCIDTAAKQCDKVIVVMFINGDEEIEIMKSYNDKELQVDSRTDQLRRVCEFYDNVKFEIIDDAYCRTPEGANDWWMETAIIRKWIPVMNYVYSSESSYDKFFREAYPEAKHIIVDEKRIIYPISGTMIRAMRILEEKQKWMV